MRAKLAKTVATAKVRAKTLASLLMLAPAISLGNVPAIAARLAVIKRLKKASHSLLFVSIDLVFIFNVKTQHLYAAALFEIFNPLFYIYNFRLFL